MAEISVSVELVEKMIFGLSKNRVRISNARFDFPHRVIVFNIDGEDVPDAAQVTGIFRTNEQGNLLASLTFEAVA